MKKRVLAMLLALVMCAGLIGPGTARADRALSLSYTQEVPGGTITYRADIDEDLGLGIDEVAWSGKWYVSKCSDGVTQADLLGHVSTQVQGRDFSGPVTEVTPHAFYNNTSLTSVTIPEGVTSIMYGAFHGCTGLKSASLPSSLTWLDDSVFYGCSSLTGIVIPDSVTEVDRSTFQGCTSLASVTLPKNLTTIGSNAFAGCAALTSVTLPSGLTTIGSGAFQGCTGLASVTIPDSVTTLDSNAFANCTGLSNVTVPDSLLDQTFFLFGQTPWLKSLGDLAIIRGTLVRYQGKDATIDIPDSVTRIGPSAFSYSSLTSVTIPDSVTSIGPNAFVNSKNLASVIIGNNVSSIGQNAFEGCQGLTSVSIPGSVTSIGPNAFADCAGLREFQVSSSNQNYTSVDGVLFTKDMKTLLVYPKKKAADTYSVPSGVVNIEAKAFLSCEGLTSVSIPEGVKEIGAEAFYNSVFITSVDIPDSVTSLGEGAFRNCRRLTSISVPEHVPSIKKSTFEDCQGLTSVLIGGSMISIDHNAFKGCGKLTSVVIPDGVTSLGGYAFDGCKSLASITLPNSVIKIDSYAFRNCNALKDVYYAGTEASWEKINIGPYSNDCLTSAARHYGNIAPTQPTTPDKPATQFSDVKAEDWFYDAVNWAVEKGITNGTGNGFSPNEDCTHDHILTFLWRAAGKPESTAKLPFTPKNSWAAGALAWAYEKGMIGADIDENAACTSADAVVYIWQAKGKPAASYDGRFTDVSEDAPYAPAVAWAADSDVTTGTSATTFGPATVCSRARIVTFLQRAFQ